MKKFFLLSLLMASISAFAYIEPTSYIIFKASCASGTDATVYAFAHENFSADFDDEQEATLYPNDTETYSKVFNFYAVCAWGEGKAAQIAENSLEGIKMAFESNKIASENYTITFSNVSIEGEYYLKDSKVQDAAGNDSLTAIVAGGTYSFTQAVSTTEERFEIVKKPAEPTICHQYGNLIITGHQGAKVKVLDMADQVAIAEQTLATDDEVISLSELTSGEMYQVVVDDGEPMLIRIQ